MASRSRFPWHIPVFILPGLLIYTVFSAWPLLDTMFLSFFKQTDSGETFFSGFANYQELLTDPDLSAGFWNATWNNVKFFLIHVFIQNPIGLMLAALLSLKDLRGAKTYRTLIFIPTLLSVVIIGFTWQLILSPLWGITPNFLKSIGLGDWFQPWLGQEHTALITLALISVWQFVGIPMMLIYASLIGIPDELIDAAKVDGASPMRIFWQIKLPLIAPTLGLVTILTFIGNFNAFDLIYAVKGVLAGPNFSTDILGSYFYRTYFGAQSSLGSTTMGATVATVMFFIILFGVMVYLYLVQRRIHRYQL